METLVNLLLVYQYRPTNSYTLISHLKIGYVLKKKFKHQIMHKRQILAKSALRTFNQSTFYTLFI